MLLLFCLIRNKTPKSCRRIVTFCHSGEILSNLVTLFKDNDKKHWPNFVYFQFRVHFPKLVTNSRTANCSNNAYSNKKWWREGDSNTGPQDASLLSYGSFHTLNLKIWYEKRRPFLLLSLSRSCRNIFKKIAKSKMSLIFSVSVSKDISLRGERGVIETMIEEFVTKWRQ